MRTSSRVAAVFVFTSIGGVVGGACNQSGGSEWTWMGGDERSTFNNTKEKTLTTNNVGRLGPGWTSTNFGTVNGAPTVVHDVTYVLSNTGLYALDAATGRQIWRNADATGTSSPTYNNGWLFVYDGKAMLRAIDAKDGRQIWQVKVDPHPKANGFSSPVVFDNYVIVGSSSSDEVTAVDFSDFRGAVVAYNRKTGAQIWRRYTVEPPFNGATVWSSVSIDAELGLVYATNGNNYTGQASETSDSIFALRLNDGSVAWWTQLYKGDVFTVPNQGSPDYDFGTNPIVFDGTVQGRRRRLVGAGQKAGIFWALDRQTGAVVWSRKLSTEGGALIGGIFNNGAFDGRNVIVAANRASSTAPGSEPPNGESFAQQPNTAVVFALNPGDGSVVWERQIPAWVWAPLTIANGIGFVAFENQLQAFNVATGAKLFNYTTNGTITSAPVVADGAVFFGSGLSYFVGKSDRTLHSLVLDGRNYQPDAGADDGGTDSGPPLPPTFTAVYQQVLTATSCSGPLCHGGGVGNFSITSQPETYASLVGVAASGPACSTSGLTRVVPGDPEASLLYNKIANRP
ncbi:MAG TPA: PQQ-binding-like beta-propeller repeat protein, partial [Polyangiaceae bacterium]|nr:PQQ-binding-like beta-propeller repeat protein [Polyangiaceae bacterium]